ncbi:hypothetical protein BV25DRAFT_708284 [Artomyces pyxidatus]|uniref:Uncharacterized protein n=1 Tax=Artomyces pyxidatus TaxID=48021 RepID=A0ACB8SZJ5_9AGAM|nr:hypothetical protein BV25DRAFT_708284 [Artomyces pyxidatus]
MDGRQRPRDVPPASRADVLRHVLVAPAAAVVGRPRRVGRGGLAGHLAGAPGAAESHDGRASRGRVGHCVGPRRVRPGHPPSGAPRGPPRTAVAAAVHRLGPPAGCQHVRGAGHVADGTRGSWPSVGRVDALRRCRKAMLGRAVDRPWPHCVHRQVRTREDWQGPTGPISSASRFLVEPTMACLDLSYWHHRASPMYGDYEYTSCHLFTCVQTGVRIPADVPHGRSRHLRRRSRSCIRFLCCCCRSAEDLILRQAQASHSVDIEVHNASRYCLSIVPEARLSTAQDALTTERLRMAYPDPSTSPGILAFSGPVAC